MSISTQRSLLLGARAIIVASALFQTFAIVGCTPAANDGGTGGSDVLGTGGVSATGGAATGGRTETGGSPATGGRATGGETATGGSPGTGGSSTGGAGGGSTGGRGGGLATGGAGGKGGSTSGGGGSSTGGNTGAGGGSTTAAQPSAGCGKSNPQTGSGSSPLTVSGHQYYVKLPSSYDPSKPYRTMFVFNPTNNPITWAEQSAGFEQLAKDSAIRVYPHPANSSNGWVASDVSFFQPLYDSITSNFCVDKARVFATGESSGGDFSSILGCEHANKLRSAAPCSTKDVPQYPLNASSRKCTGQVAAVVIQGKNDSVVGPANGPKTRDFYVALNHCGSMTQPVQGYTDTLSNCVLYQGCDAGYPVYWCQHTDPNYSGTNHGWPAFAPKFLWQLWSSY